MTEDQEPPTGAIRKLIYLADGGMRLRYLHVMPDERVYVIRRDVHGRTEGYSRFTLEQLRASLEKEGFELREDIPCE